MSQVFPWVVEVYHLTAHQWLVWSRERNRASARYAARQMSEAIEHSHFTSVRYRGVA